MTTSRPDQPAPFCRTASPVLFLIFNRPQVTGRVFQAIRQARPPRLYVAADGPRKNRPDDAPLCAQTRSTVETIDWPCQVKTLFRQENLGCRDAITSAITWFFENEEEGIILEDDCLPAPDFFKFCDCLLEHYRHDPRVRHISGDNFQRGRKRGNASYYFSRVSHVWGWATWRRAWADYDKTLSRYELGEIKYMLFQVFGGKSAITQGWLKIAENLKNGKPDTWAYQWALTNLMNNALCAMPNVNLVSNIGFGNDPTHTKKCDSPYANIPLEYLTRIRHPIPMVADTEADYQTQHDDFTKNHRWRRVIAALRIACAP
jgi:hypothetical protein